MAAMMVVFWEIYPISQVSSMAHDPHRERTYLEIVDVCLRWVGRLSRSGLENIVYVEVVGLLLGYQYHMDEMMRLCLHPVVALD